MRLVRNQDSGSVYRGNSGLLSDRPAGCIKRGLPGQDSSQPEKRMKYHMETQSIKGRDSLTGKKGLVIGAGRSGSGSASLLLACGAEAVLYDGNTGLEQEKLKQDVRNLLLHECSFNAEDADSVLSALYIILGDLDTEIAKKADFAVLSPGVPTDSPLVEQLKKEGLPI